MPKKVFTEEDIQNLLADQKKNVKWTTNSDDGITTRLEAAALEAQGITVSENDYLTINDGKVRISNNAKIKTDVNLNTNREYYEANSFQSTFDTEITSITQMPKPEETPVEPPPPPPKPAELQIGCQGWIWAMKGLRGLRDKDTAEWQDNIFPKGNNPGGGYLFIPGDHALFYIRHLNPKNARASFNYEWKLDGEVQSHEPFLRLWEIGAQEVEDDQWRDAPDRVVELRVWNEVGEARAKARFRCTKRIYNNDFTDAEGEGIPKAAWELEDGGGYVEPDYDRFYDGKWNPYTSKIRDRSIGLRSFRLKNIIVPHIGQSVYTSTRRFGPLSFYWEQYPYKGGEGAYQLSQGNSSTQTELGYSNTQYSMLGASHKRLMTLRDAAWKSKLESEFPNNTTIFDNCRPFGRSPENGGANTWNVQNVNRTFLGRIGQGKVREGKQLHWYDFPKFFSGYDIPGGNPLDLKHFMKMDKTFTEGGVPDPDGESTMDAINRWPHAAAQPGEKVEFACVFGYKAVENDSKKIYYLYYGNVVIDVTEEHDWDNDVEMTLKRHIVKYSEDPGISFQPDIPNQFTPSSAVSFFDMGTGTSIQETGQMEITDEGT